MLCLPRKARATVPAKMRKTEGWARNRAHLRLVTTAAMNSAAAAGTVTVSKAATCKNLINSEGLLQQ